MLDKSVLSSASQFLASLVSVTRAPWRSPACPGKPRGLQDRLVPLVEAACFDEAYLVASFEGPAQDLDPAEELCAAMERAGVQLAGARWLQGWFLRSAPVPGFAAQAVAAGAFLSRHLSPRQALQVLQPLAERRPDEFGPSAAVAAALLAEDPAAAREVLVRCRDKAREPGDRAVLRRLLSGFA